MAGRVIRRHDARVIALAALFSWGSTGDNPADIFDRVVTSFFPEEVSPRDDLLPSEDKRFEYAFRLFLAVTENCGTIDPHVSRFSLGWPISRMPRVDLSIVRLAVAETVWVGDAPLEVVVNEALELANEFGAHASPRFVNGVLMGILREMGYAKDTP